MFSDMSPEETKDYMGLNNQALRDEYAGKSEQQRPSHSQGRGRGLVDVPNSKNWAEEGYMHPVKNQGNCGSCWAFAVSTTLEGTLAIK